MRPRASYALPLSCLTVYRNRRSIHWLRLLAEIRNYFYSGKSWWLFLLCLAFENQIVLRGVHFIVYKILNPPRSSPGAILLTDYLWRSCIQVPVTETFEYQLLLIELGRLLKLPVGAQHILSMAVFAIMHYAGGGLAHGLCAGLVGGFYLAWTYLYFRQRSFWLALGMTIALHSLHNFICIWI